jgi:hypothetical protein
MLSAAKAGFVTLEYGQSRAFEPPKYIVIDDSVRIQRADLSLPKGAVIVGRVSDELGAPFADAIVTIVTYEYENGRSVRRVVSTGKRPIATNEDGLFRISGVPPGSYFVTARPDLVFESTDDSVPEQYVETYSPAATGPDKALRIVASREREVTANIQLARARVIHVNGTVIGSDGKPPRAQGGIVRLTEVGASVPTRLAQMQPNGAFAFATSARPGQYVIAASTPSSSQGPQEPELGKVAVKIANDDITGLRVRLNRGATVTGQVVAESGRLNNTVRSLRIYAKPVDFDGGLIGSMGVPLDGSGRFVLRNVFEPSFILTDLNPRTGWYVKKVLIDGQDVTKSGLIVNPGQRIGDVMVTVSSRLSEVDGVVSSRSGQIAGDSVVLLFAEHEEQWADPLGRYVSVVRSQSNGRYSVVGLPPGPYLAIALDALRMGFVTDPQLLRGLRRSAHRVAVREGITTTVDLTLVTSRQREQGFFGPRHGPH